MQTSKSGRRYAFVYLFACDLRRCTPQPTVHTVHLSVCLLVCLALCLPGCQSKRMGSRLKDAVDVEAGAALVRLPRGRRWLLLMLMLPLLFVLVKQRRHEGVEDGDTHKKKNTSRRGKK